MRICHIVNSFDTGGLEHGIVKIINQSKSDFTHQIIALRKVGHLTSKLPQDTFVSCLNIQGNDRLSFLKISNLMKLLDPEIVHVRNLGPFSDAVLAGLITFRKKIIFGFHGKNISELKPPSLKKRLYFCFLSRFLTAVSTLNWHMASDISSLLRLNKEKIHIIPNGIEISNYYLPGICRKKLIEKIQASSDTHLVGYVGRLDRVKNISTLLNAINLLKDTIKIDLIIIGDGPERHHLESVSDRYQMLNTHFLGERDDIEKILAGLDLYVQPSWYEGFSNTILEAMAAGLPVIASNTGGNSELVDEGCTGFLFDPSDPFLLSKKINDVLSLPDTGRSMGNKAREFVMKKYTLQKMVSGYENLYRSL